MSNKTYNSALVTVRVRLMNELQNHFGKIQSFNDLTNPNILKYRLRAMCESYHRFRDNFLEIEITSAFDQNSMSQMQLENNKLEEDYFQSKAAIADLNSSIDEQQFEEQATHNSTLQTAAFRTQNLSATSHLSSSKPTGKLPPIEIPKFSGRVSDWEEWSNLFTSLIMEEQSLSDIIKMHYLKTSVTNDAAKVIKHLPASAHSLPAAWFLLQQAYQNRRSIVEDLIGKFISLKPLKENDSDGLREMMLITNNMISGLSLQGIDTQTWDPIIVYLLVDKMDENTVQHWENSLGDCRDMPTLKRLFIFLEQRTVVEQRAQLRKANSVSSQKQDKSEFIAPNSVSSMEATIKGTEDILTSIGQGKCVICSQRHRPQSCPTFIALNISERRRIAKNLKICTNCLYKHEKECTSKFSCSRCGQRHHTLLHEEKTMVHINQTEAEMIESTNEENKIINETVENNSNEAANDIASLPLQSFTINAVNERALLPTARVFVETANQRKIRARVLLDQGSQANFISSRLCKLIGVTTYPACKSIHGLSCSVSQIAREHTTFQIESIHNNAFAMEVNAYVIPRITYITPSHMNGMVDWPHVEGLNLADPDHNRGGEIDILLGGISFAELLLFGVKKN